jgi:hypothetical protein
MGMAPYGRDRLGVMPGLLLVEHSQGDALFHTVNLVPGGFDFADPGAQVACVSERPDHHAGKDDRQYRVDDIDGFHHVSLDGESRVFGDLRALLYSLASFAPRFAWRQNKYKKIAVLSGLKPGPISEAKTPAKATTTAKARSRSSAFGEG